MANYCRWPMNQVGSLTITRVELVGGPWDSDNWHVVLGHPALLPWLRSKDFPIQTVRDHYEQSQQQKVQDPYGLTAFLYGGKAAPVLDGDEWKEDGKRITPAKKVKVEWQALYVPKQDEKGDWIPALFFACAVQVPTSDSQLERK